MDTIPGASTTLTQVHIPIPEVAQMDYRTPVVVQDGPGNIYLGTDKGLFVLRGLNVLIWTK